MKYSSKINPKKTEARIAKEFGGKRNRGSGNKWYNPSDIKSLIYLIESKETNKESFSIKRSVWEKLYEEALFSKKIPLLHIRIQDLELVVISKQDFLKKYR